MKTVAFQNKSLTMRGSYYDGDTIFVTFQSAIMLGRNQEGFGERLFESRKISALHFLPEHHNWYQFEGMIGACEIAKEIAGKFKKVICYGASMGGYAAVNFATLLGATDVIAISPQYTVDPSRAPLETRYCNAFHNMERFYYDQPPGRDWSRTTVNILIDPFDRLDAYQAALAQLEIPAAVVRLNHSSHPCTQVMSADTLKRFVLNAADDPHHAREELIRNFKIDRGHSWIYWLNLARQYGLSSPKRALACAQMAHLLQGKHSDIPLTVGTLLHMLGRHEDSVIEFRKSIRLNDTNPGAYAGIARSAIAMRDEVAAADAIEMAERLRLPTDSVSYLRSQLATIQETTALSVTRRQFVPSQNAGT